MQANKLITDKTKLVIAPETAISLPFHREKAKEFHPFQHLQKQVNQWDNISLITGAATFSFFDKKIRNSIKQVKNKDLFYELYNDLVVLRKNSSPQFHSKSKLVLGTEKFPFGNSLPFIEEVATKFGSFSGTIGTNNTPKLLSTSGFYFAPIICYESVYGNFVANLCNKGAELIIIITNDGWWKNSAIHKQHNSFARLRAIENRRYVARSANTGISSIINQRGDIIQQTKYDELDSIHGTVHLNRKKTIYTQFGNYIGLVSTIIFTFLMIFQFLKWITKKTN